jgi:hypothetical protein
LRFFISILDSFVLRARSCTAQHSTPHSTAAEQQQHATPHSKAGQQHTGQQQDMASKSARGPNMLTTAAVAQRLQHAGVGSCRQQLVQSLWDNGAQLQWQRLELYQAAAAAAAPPPEAAEGTTMSAS